MTHKVKIVSEYNGERLENQIKKVLENLDEVEGEILDLRYSCCYNTDIKKIYHTVCIIWS